MNNLPVSLQRPLAEVTNYVGKMPSGVSLTELNNKVNALLAKCRGVDVEVKELGNWVLSNSAIFPSAIYRIKPKATPLPIPNWFWNGISKSLTKAVLDPELDTITFFPKYVTPRIEDGHWITDDHPYYNYVNPALIGVSLKDIDWRLSLTERQGEVNHES